MLPKKGLFLHSPMPYALFGSDGRCMLTNPAFRSTFGGEPLPGYNAFQDEVTEPLGIPSLLRRAFEGETVETPAFWYDPRQLRHVRTTETRRVALSCTCFPLKSRGGAAVPGSGRDAPAGAASVGSDQ